MEQFEPDFLEEDGKDLETVEEILSTCDQYTLSCNNRFCAAYAVVPADSMKRFSSLSWLGNTPVLLYVGERATVVGLIVPPFVHLVVVVKAEEEAEDIIIPDSVE